MARCGECTSSCQCEMTQDGVLSLADAEGAVFDLIRTGRLTSTVEGSGSSANPFTVSFVDSLEYRPPAAHGVSTTVGFGDGAPHDVEWTSKTYGTPLPSSGFVFILPAFPEELYITDGLMQVVGASLVFTGGISGNYCAAEIQVGISPTYQRHTVGGHWGYPDTGGTVILNMTGTFMGRIHTETEVSGIQAIAQVAYISTSPLTLQSVKFWMCQV